MADGRFTEILRNRLKINTIPGLLISCDGLVVATPSIRGSH
jgi:hypothetical protein